MEAYQAYYNTNESSLAAGNAIGPKTIDEEEGQKEAQNMKIINNIMHINHSGANINIMCGGNGDEKEQQQNNFIFNHTAPINLNFYEEVKKKGGPDKPVNNVVTNQHVSGEQELETKEKSQDEAEEVVTRSPNRKNLVS
jgi:hypothetical protein